MTMSTLRWLGCLALGAGLGTAASTWESRPSVTAEALAAPVVDVDGTDDDSGCKEDCCGADLNKKKLISEKAPAPVQ